MKEIEYRLKSKKIEAFLTVGSVVIYGAGETTKGVMKYINGSPNKRNLIAIVDNAKEKQSSFIGGIKVTDPSLIGTLNPSTVIISVEHLEVSNQISQSLSPIRSSIKIFDLNDCFPFYSHLTSIHSAFEKISQIDTLPLLIFQQGKVGSTTLLQSFKAQDPSMPIWHAHDLSRKYRIWTQDHISELPFVKQVQLLTTDGHDKKMKVISLVRDPIARNISAFFQIMTDEKLLKDTGFLIDEFFQNFKHEYPLNWFDIEIKELLGIDVYETSFDQENGYQIYESEDVDLLVMRLEDLKACAKKAIEAFLGISSFTLHNANVGEKKNYQQSYQAFKEKIQIPDSYIKSMYESKYARHFYSERELANFRTKWMGASI